MLAYLRKRGYQWTEEQLKSIKASATATAQAQQPHSAASSSTAAQSSATALAASSSSSSSSSPSVDDVLGDLAMDVNLDVHACLLHSLFTSHPRLSSPEAFDFSYSQLKHFISNCVDVYASELRAVLWPLFLHSFLALFMRGCPSDALIFLGQHRKEHEQNHHGELTLLGQLHNESHIRQSDYTRLALTRKMEITVSAPPTPPTPPTTTAITTHHHRHHHHHTLMHSAAACRVHVCVRVVS